MKFLHIILGVLIITFALSCTNSQEKEDESVPTEIVDFFSLEKKKMSDLLLTVGKPTQYILLKCNNEEQLLGRINKVKICNGKIYALDSRSKILQVYDKKGNWQGNVGTVGQGPKELVSMTDFDVDAQGNVYILDGRLDKLYVYDCLTFDCISEYKLPFEADVLSVLNADSIFYGLSSWNNGSGKGFKVALANKRGDIMQKYLEYTEPVDPGYWISDYQFGRTPVGIAYHQTICNDIALFTHHGELEKIIHFDFGSKTVPKKDKVDIERKIANYDQYVMIKKVLGVTEDFIIGLLWENRNTKLFVLDRINKICYLGEKVNDDDQRIGCGLCDEGIIFCVDEENETFPDSVNEYVRKENLILQIKPFKD